MRAPWTLHSGALFRRDSGESGPALLDFFTAALRTEDFSLLVVDKGQDFGEVFLAVVAEKFVVRRRASSGKEWLGRF
jgi:hypothetical protein